MRLASTEHKCSVASYKAPCFRSSDQSENLLWRYLMSIFEDLACVAWKSNPLFWQAVGGLHAAKTAGAIKNRSQCESLAKEGAAQFGIPSLIGNTAASCACK